MLSLILILSGCGKSSYESITAVGSTAVQPLVEQAASKYDLEHDNTYINVQGGGSGTGLSQIQQGAVDIGSSDLYAEQKKGIDASKLVDHRICAVGMVPIVNKEVKINNLTLTQLKDIFSGKIKNWKEVGGQNLDITIVNRADGSGTRTAFANDVMGDTEFASSQEQDSTGTVRQIVKNTDGAISYVSMPYLDNNTKPLKVNGVKATVENVQSNAWPIWSYEHLYTKGEPKGLTKKFLAYLMTDEVQNKIVKEMKYVPIKDMQYEKDANNKLIKK
ncbi:phosphate ABC transporter substrate-binding protein [Lactobacillus terrae]|uniref:phosphate ABC transporter substrate-binding protein n=1 Tax=Lactobacillus terrae TaxID=2269374 RepID=UPI000C1B7721|nr:phosphate ABC transporter substrate-binding protein [Lactobacillus terrae]